MSWISANLAPLMFAGMVLFMLIGYPAAFSLAATGLFFGFLGIEFGLIRPDFLGNLTYQLFGIISNDLLLAIPFFTFMGAILERCGLAEDLLDSIGQLFGPVRGGLSYAVIFVGAILGAITGTVAASVIAMGVISMTPMLKYGYSTRHTMGVIAASGTITQLIPPSLVLVVLADQLGRSVGDMYAGAIGPSLIQIALFCIWVAILGIIRPQDVPALPLEARTLRGWPLLRKMPARHHPVAWPDLPRARHDLHGPRHPDRSRRHGRGRRHRAGRLLRHPDVAPALSGHGLDHAHHRHGGLHPDRRARVQPGVPGRRRQGVDRGYADDAAGRTARLPDLRQRLRLRDRVLPRLLRDRLHHHSAAGAGGGKARHRPDLVRRADLRQHPDELHAPAVRVCAVLPTRHSAALGEDVRYLLGRHPWVVLQVILVAIVILWPGSVTYWIDKSTSIDPSRSEIDIPMPDLRRHSISNKRPRGVTPGPPGRLEFIQPRILRIMKLS